MPKRLNTCFRLLVLLFGITCAAFAQEGQDSRTNWIVHPSEDRAMVENLGQCVHVRDLPADRAPQYMLLDQGMEVYFGTDGITYRAERFNEAQVQKRKAISAAKKAFKEDGIVSPEDLHDRKLSSVRVTDTFQVNMQWKGANSKGEFVPFDPVAQRYLFHLNRPDLPKTVRAKGYEKLLLKDLYPKVDLEYVLHHRRGIKYNLILHPGAKLSKIQMDYADADRLELDDHGNLLIYYGNSHLIDHAPNTYSSDGKPLKSRFVLNGKTVSFEVEGYDKRQGLVIDPWIIDADSVNGVVVDVETDELGFVTAYVGIASSSTWPFLINKYNPNGQFIWSAISASSSFVQGGWYGDLFVVDNTGETFYSQANNLWKLDSAGNELWVVHNEEPWTLVIGCNPQVLYVGGRWQNQFQGEFYLVDHVSGVNLFPFVPGIPLTDSLNDEIRSSTANPIGDYYSVTSKTLIKVCPAMELQYEVPHDHDYAYDGYSYHMSGTPGAHNGIVADTMFIFTRDGKKVSKWDESNGTLIDTLAIPNSGFPPPVILFTSGIWLDSCQNVYIGSTEQIYVYDVDFNFLDSIPVDGRVSDIAPDSHNIIIAGGENFIQSLNITHCARNACAPPPNPYTVSNDTSMCIGEDVPLLVTGGTSYYWRPNNTLSDSLTANPIASPNQTTTYQVKISFDSCYFITDTVRVVVNDTNFNILANPDPACPGDSVLITTDSNSALYFTPSTPIISAASDSVWAILDTTMTFSVRTSPLDGCSKSFTLNVRDEPAPLSFFPFPAHVCLGDSVQLEVRGAEQYTWTASPTLSNNLNDPLVFASPSVQTTYYVTGIDTNSCSIDDSVTVAVFDLPVVTAQQSDTTICPGESVTLSAFGANTYFWSPTDSLSADSGRNVVASPSQTQTYIVNGVRNNGCSDTAQLTIHVLPVPSLTFSVSQDTICFGDTVQVRGSSSSAISWTSSEPLVLLNDSTAQTAPTGMVTFGGTVVASNGCSNSEGFSIESFPNPNVSINSTFANTLLCSGDQASISASGATIYQWQPANLIQPDTGTTVSLIPQNGQVYTVTGTTLQGCSDSDQVSFQVVGCGLNVPNVFSPDGDGNNEEFMVDATSVVEMQCEIFNRWGTSMYQTALKGIHWDGTADGLPVPSGVYFYVIDYTDNLGETHRKQGSLTLIR